MSAFGQFIPPTDIEDKILAVLKLWFYTYLRGVEAATDRPNQSLPNIKSWELASDDEKFPENQTPALQLTWELCETVGHGADGLAGVVDFSCLVFVEASSFKGVRSLASAYAFAVAAIAEQKLINEPLFDGISNPRLGLPVITHREQRRFRAMGTCDFTVTTNGILDPLFEPEEVSEETVPGDYPTVEDIDSVIVDVEPQDP